MDMRDISDGHYEWLVDEMKSWTALGLMTPEQSRRILGLYAGPEERAERRGARSISALMGLSALLVGLAVFLLVAFNWEAMSAAAKLAFIFATPGASHWGGWVLRYKRKNREASDIVFFLGSLFYGAAIALIGQIFNINVTDASGFWWWAVGVLPFALIVGSLPLHALLAVILAWYTCATTVSSFWWGGGMGRGGGFSSAAVSVPILAAPGIIWAYRRRSVRALGLYVALIAFWVVMQPLAWRFDEAPVYWIGAVGALLTLIAECHRPRDEMALPHRFFGVALAGGALIPLAVYDFNKNALRTVMSMNLSIEMAAALVAGALLLMVAADIDRRRTGRETSLLSAVVEAKRRWFPLAMIVFFSLLGFWKASFGLPLVTTIAANAAMVGLSIWLMRVGLTEDRGRPFLAGVAYFLIWSISRYIDLFGDFGGMPGAALMFFLCGAGLYGMTRFWAMRKAFQHV